MISREIPKRLVQKKHSVELISIEDLQRDKDRLTRMIFKNRVIGFGFPVY